MQAFIELHRRLDQAQQTLWFHLAASVLVLAACGGVFGFMLAKSYSLHAQHQAIVQAISNQNLERGDEHAVTLDANGEIFVNGRRYGGEEFKNPPRPLFDADGNILAPPVLADMLLRDQRPQWVPTWMLEQPDTTWMLALLTTGWLLLIIWINLALPFLLTLLGTAIPVLILWRLDQSQLMLACAGIGLLTFTFVLLTRAALLLLSQPWQVASVAHTVIKEASRTRISLVFIILLLATLPLLPLGLDPEAPLRYQMQTFIARSVGLTFIIAAVMTLFLSCASVAFEIRDRQIWQLMTKPLGRLNYLLGKWLGVMMVNIIILLVAGVSTFTFIQYLREQPPLPGEAGILDSLAVRDEVLTARIGAKPDYEKLDADQLRARVDQLILQDPELSRLEEVPLALRMAKENEIKENYLQGQRTVPPQGERSYTYRGLKRARELNSTLTLKYRFHILRDDEHEKFQALFGFNDDPNTARISTYVPTMTHSFPIGPHLIQDDGTLKVTIVNLNPPSQGGFGALNFEEKDFELLYKVGNFETNFLRAMLMTWVKLAFLGALGIACATFLSFPVACLLAFTIFLGGMLGPFLAEALKWYYPPEVEQVDWGNIFFVLYWAFEWFTRSVALVIQFLLKGFGEYRPTNDLVEGRLIPWASVGWGFVKLGLVWSGLAMIIGYVVMRNRQLAIYSGHG